MGGLVCIKGAFDKIFLVVPEAEFPPVDRRLNDGGGGFGVFLPLFDGWDDLTVGVRPMSSMMNAERIQSLMSPEGIELLLHPLNGLGRSSSR